MSYTVDILESNPGIKYGVDPMGSRNRTYELHPTEAMYDWLTAQGIVGACWDFQDLLESTPRKIFNPIDAARYGEMFVIIGLKFTFDRLDHAVMFKLAWA